MKRGLKYKIMGPIFGGFLLVLIVLVALAIIIPKGQITKIGEDKGKTLSKITAESLMSALMFDDTESCKGNLANLKKDEAVIIAEVFDKTGKSVAKILNVKDDDEERLKEKQKELEENYAAAFDPKTLPDIGKDSEEMKDMRIERIQIAGQSCELFSSKIINADNNELMGYLNIALSLKSVQEATSTISTSMILISLISLLVIGFVSNMIISRMIKPLIDASDMMGVLSEGEGDLTARLEVKSNDEIGKLAENFNSFIEKLRDIIMQVKDASTEINDGTGEISAGSEDLSTRTSEQAASITETSTTLEGFTAIVKVNTENSGEVREKLENFNGEMRTKKDLMDNVTSTMKEIEDSSKKIDNIINVINDISFQTNLLALNAAVEAARAGEHGKGFAVVADEVRSLAQRAAQAARETTGLIEDAVGRTRQGTQVAEDVGKSLGAIVKNVTHVSDLIDGIAKASAEQAQGVEQVNASVTQMDRVTQQTASTAEESASASEELSAQANTLRNVVKDLAQIIAGRNAQLHSSRSSSSPLAKAPAAKASAVSRPPAPVHSAPPASKPSASTDDDFTTDGFDDF